MFFKILIWGSGGFGFWVYIISPSCMSFLVKKRKKLYSVAKPLRVLLWVCYGSCYVAFWAKKDIAKAIAKPIAKPLCVFWQKMD